MLQLEDEIAKVDFGGDGAAVVDGRPVGGVAGEGVGAGLEEGADGFEVAVGGGVV